MKKVKKILNESDLVFEEKPKHWRFQDLEGQEFRRLTVLGCAGRKKGHTYWFTRCDCGNVTRVGAGNLKNGHTVSCGCFMVEQIKERNTTHGHTGNATHRSWAAMLKRCQNQNGPDYPNYGGRGIEVCDEWQKFENFLADMKECPRGLSLDRINNEGNYEPGNCRWATIKEQNNNTRSNHHLTFNGKTQNITQWVDELGLNYNTIFARINTYGWPVERALTEVVRKNI